jgi:hypothetical protein
MRTEQYSNEGDYPTSNDVRESRASLALGMCTAHVLRSQRPWVRGCVLSDPGYEDAFSAAFVCSARRAYGNNGIFC